MIMLPAILATLAAAPMAPIDTTIRLARGTVVRIDGAMSGVRLRTTAGDQLTINGAGNVQVTPGQVRVEAGFFRGRDRGPLTVIAPAWARVEIEGVSGEIVVDQAPAELDIESFDGAVTVAGGTGTMTISNAAGPVTVRGFAGRTLEVESLSGRVTIDGATGTVRVETVNEQVVLRNIRSRAVTVGSTNGGIEWSGPFESEGRYEFSSHNGGIEFRVPRSLDARFRVTTFQGGFETTIPGITTGNGARPQGTEWGGEREFTVTYGRGTAAVRVETFNGAVRVRSVAGT